MPDDIASHFSLCRIERRIGDYKQAIYHGRRVLQLNPLEYNASLNLGLAYEAEGNLRLAKKYYNLELQINPYSRETLYNLGYLYFNRHRWRQAIGYFYKYLNCGYGFRLDDVVRDLGFCCYKVRDISLYIQIHQKYLDRKPFTAWALLNIGLAYLHSKNYGAAITKLELATRLGADKNIREKVSLARRLYKAR